MFKHLCHTLCFFILIVWSQSKNNTQLWMWLVIEQGPICKERYCIGIWNVTSMNQGKLEVVKQEMARVNVNILGISELKWTGRGEFNLRWPLYQLLWAGIPQKKWSSHHGQKKSPKCSTWMQSQKQQNDSVCFQGKPFNTTVLQVYAPTSNAEVAEVERF